MDGRGRRSGLTGAASATAAVAAAAAAVASPSLGSSAYSRRNSAPAIERALSSNQMFLQSRQHAHPSYHEIDHISTPRSADEPDAALSLPHNAGTPIRRGRRGRHGTLCIVS